MSLFDQDIVTSEPNVSKKFRFLIELKEYIDKHKNGFRLRASHTEGNLSLTNLLEINLEAERLMHKIGLTPFSTWNNTHSHGRFKYIKGDLYVVYQMSDSHENEIRRQFIDRRTAQDFVSLSSTIERECEPVGEVILIYDKDMNCIKEKYRNFGY